VLADTLLFTPFHVIGFFAFMNAVEGGSFKVKEYLPQSNSKQSVRLE
jgi:hypothetical protein